MNRWSILFRTLFENHQALALAGSTSRLGNVNNRSSQALPVQMQGLPGPPTVSTDSCREVRTRTGSDPPPPVLKNSHAREHGQYSHLWGLTACILGLQVCHGLVRATLGNP